MAKFKILDGNIAVESEMIWGSGSRLGLAARAKKFSNFSSGLGGFASSLGLPKIGPKILTSPLLNVTCSTILKLSYTYICFKITSDWK